MYIYEENFYEKQLCNLLTYLIKFFVNKVPKTNSNEIRTNYNFFPVKPDMFLKCIEYLTLLFIRCSYYFLITHFYSWLF